jgi:hypothetical protein
MKESKKIDTHHQASLETVSIVQRPQTTGVPSNHPNRRIQELHM